MCLPSPCSPCSPSPGQFATDIKLTPEEIQGLADFCGNLLGKLGCADRAARDQKTLLGITHENLLRALQESYPSADPNCMSSAVQGIITAVGEAFVQCPNGQTAFIQALLTKIAQPIGQLLTCILGQQRTNEVQIQLAVYTGTQAINWISCLLPILIQLFSTYCGGTVTPPTPPAPPTGGGCCPPVVPPPGGGGDLFNRSVLRC